MADNKLPSGFCGSIGHHLGLQGHLPNDDHVQQDGKRLVLQLGLVNICSDAIFKAVLFEIFGREMIVYIGRRITYGGLQCVSSPITHFTI